jgi:hypothetical protein
MVVNYLLIYCLLNAHGYTIDSFNPFGLLFRGNIYLFESVLAHLAVGFYIKKCQLELIEQ